MTSRVVFKIIIWVVLFVTVLKMSMNRLAIVAAIGTHNSMRNRSDDIRDNKHPVIEAHERPNANEFNGDVNILLGGAMLSIVISIVCFLCYCCHRNQHKPRELLYRQRWLQVEPNMDIYSVEQYYDITANNGIDDDQYTRIIRNQGPPPAYEIAVTMKSPISIEKCHLCQNKILLRCACDLDTTKGAEDNSDKTDDNLLMQSSSQLLDVKNISQYRRTCCMSESGHTNQYYTTEICPKCEEELPSKNNNINDEDERNGNGYTYCQCAKSRYHRCNKTANVAFLKSELESELGTTNSPDINDNVPSTSGDVNVSQNCDFNCSCEESDDEVEDEEGEFDSLNENGIIRVNMKKIIDESGLPTYEAALKLESTGYV